MIAPRSGIEAFDTVVPAWEGDEVPADVQAEIDAVNEEFQLAEMYGDE